MLQTPALTKNPRYSDNAVERAIMPYLLSLLCSACSAWEIFCVIHIIIEETAAIMGNR